MNVTQYHIDSKSEPGTFRIVSAMEDGTWECDCPFTPRKNGGPNQRCRHILEAQAGVVAGQLESPAAPLDPEWGALTGPGAKFGPESITAAAGDLKAVHPPLVLTPAPQASVWAALREPFLPAQINQLPRGTGDQRVYLDYVGHAAVTDRLLKVDPLWNWEPLAFDEDGLPKFVEDRNGNPIGFWIKLTVAGVTRLGFGSVAANAFDAEKQLIGDALRNAAMRFGVALDLWSKSDLHSENDGPAPERGSRQQARAVLQNRGANGAPPWWQDFLAKRTDLGLTGQHVGIAIGSPCTPENVEAWVKQDPEATIEDRLNKLLSAAADAKASQR